MFLLTNFINEFLKKNWYFKIWTRFNKKLISFKVINFSKIIVYAKRSYENP